METKAEVLKYMFTRIQEMLPVNVVKAKKNKDYFTYIVENDCSIEFYFQTTQGGYAGKNTFCMGVSAKIKNPYLCSLVLEPLNKKDAGGNIIVCFDNNPTIYLNVPNFELLTVSYNCCVFGGIIVSLGHNLK